MYNINLYIIYKMPMPDLNVTTNISNFLYALIIAAVFAVFCTIGVQTESALEALIGEYCIIGAAILILLVLKIKVIDPDRLITMSSLFTLAPFLFILFIVIYYIVIISIYFTKIASNKISNYYYSFSTISTLLLVAQILLLVSSVAKANITEISKKTFSILMLLGTINGIVVVTLGIILKFYTTDC